MEKICITGVPVTPATMKELHNYITRLCHKAGPSLVLSGNVHGLNLARRTPWLLEMYEKAAVVRVDGAGVVLAARLLGRRIPPRITWADWGFPLAEYAASKEHSLYLLGGPDGAAAGASQRLATAFPTLRIVGHHHGYFVKEGPENEALLEDIRRASPDLLIVAMGMPLQEHWIAANLENLNARVILTAGAALEYLSGSLKRCPKWMGDAGLEWLFRLTLEPKRMARRYLAGNISFMREVFAQRRLNHNELRPQAN